MRKIISTIRSGFTVVELLVVIAVVAIMTGVTVVGYGKWRESVARTEVQSDLKIAGSAMKNPKNFGNGFPTSIPSTFKSSPNVTVTYVTGTATTYCIEGVSNTYSTIRYHLTNDQVSSQSGPCPVAPAAPQPVATANSTSQITVTWPAVAGATSYTLRYGTASPTTLASCTSSPCVLTGLAASTTYYVGVTASNAYGTSPQGLANATTLSSGGGGWGINDNAIGTPVVSWTSTTAATISWNPVPANSCNTSPDFNPSYIIKYHMLLHYNTPTVNVWTTATSYNASGITQESHYVDVSVACFDASGNTRVSNESGIHRNQICNTSYCRTLSQYYPTDSSP